MRKQILAVTLMAFLLIMPIVSAQTNFDEEISSENRATFDQILEPVMKVYNLVKYVATTIAVLVLLFAGISYMMGGSDPKKRDNSKAMAMYVILGLFVIWAAPLVVEFIIN